MLDNLNSTNAINTLPNMQNQGSAANVNQSSNAQVATSMIATLLSAQVPKPSKKVIAKKRRVNEEDQRIRKIDEHVQDQLKDQ